MDTIQKLKVRNANGTFEQVVPIGTRSIYVYRKADGKDTVESSLQAIENTLASLNTASYGLNRTTPSIKTKTCEIGNVTINFTLHADFGILNIQIPQTILDNTFGEDMSFDLSDIIFMGPEKTIKKKIALPKYNQWCIAEINDTTLTLHSFTELSLMGEELYLNEFIQL